MSRLTNTDYLHMCQFLRGNWLDKQSLFGTLSPNDQWLLHAYFRPSHTLTEQALLQHRADITGYRKGLPQQAGRAFTKFCTAVAIDEWRRAQVRPAPTKGQRVHNISVRAVLKPEPDAKKLVKALIRMAQLEQ